VDQAGKYLYVANQGDGTAVGTVGQYLINSDGSLTNTATMNAGKRPAGITIHPNGLLLYVANKTDGTISGYAIDATTGALTPLTPTTLPTGTAPSSVTIDPLGQALYATDRANSVIYQFTINSTTGALTPMTTSATVPAGLHPTAIATGY